MAEATTAAPATDPNNLYFSGLPLTVTAEHLCDLVRPFGEPVSSRILVNASGYSRGIGFVRMVHPDHCQSVISTLNGLRLPGTAVLLCRVEWCHFSFRL
jgi:RNA recognition motif-containing protein